MSEERKLALDGPHAIEMVKMDICAIARSGMIALKVSRRSDIKPNSPQIRDESLAMLIRNIKIVGVIN